MRIAFVSAAWGRFAVTRLALAQRRDLIRRLKAKGHEAVAVVVADDENYDIAAEYGGQPLEQNNDMLGRKFNDGIEWACVVWEADFVVLIGSDDWMHPSMFDRMPKSWAEPVLDLNGKDFAIGRAGPQCLTGREIAIVDLSGWRLRRCRGRGPAGVIPWVIPRSALPDHYRPIDDFKDRGIDGSLLRGLKHRPTWLWHDPHPYCRVDFKSSNNLNAYDRLSEGIGYGPEFDPASRLRTYYPDYLIEMVRDTARKVEA